jgi:hypothetical protein
VVTPPEGELPDRAHGRIFVDYSELYEDQIRCLARRFKITLAEAEARLDVTSAWSGDRTPGYTVDGWTFTDREVIFNKDLSLLIYADEIAPPRATLRTEESARRFHESG